MAVNVQAIYYHKTGQEIEDFKNTNIDIETAFLEGDIYIYIYIYILTHQMDTLKCIIMKAMVQNK